LSQLISDLKLHTFSQPDDKFSRRIVGGSYALVDSLVERLPRGQLRVNSAVVRIEIQTPPSVSAPILVTLGSGETLLCRRIVIAVPPQQIQASIVFSPQLPESLAAAIATNRTWMAAVTKIAWVFQSRFWPVGAGVSNAGLYAGYLLIKYIFTKTNS
jgi:monoamine oxidase